MVNCKLVMAPVWLWRAPIWHGKEGMGETPGESEVLLMWDAGKAEERMQDEPIVFSYTTQAAEGDRSRKGAVPHAFVVDRTF